MTVHTMCAVRRLPNHNRILHTVENLISTERLVNHLRYFSTFSSERVNVTMVVLVVVPVCPPFTFTAEFHHAASKEAP